jgi:hypothetical protein
MGLPQRRTRFSKSTRSMSQRRRLCLGPDEAELCSERVDFNRSHTTRQPLHLLRRSGISPLQRAIHSRLARAAWNKHPLNSNFPCTIDILFLPCRRGCWITDRHGRNVLQAPTASNARQSNLVCHLGGKSNRYFITLG